MKNIGALEQQETSRIETQSTLAYPQGTKEPAEQQKDSDEGKFTEELRWEVFTITALQ